MSAIDTWGIIAVTGLFCVGLFIFLLGFVCHEMLKGASEKRIEHLVYRSIEQFFVKLREKEKEDDFKTHLSPIQFEHCKFNAPEMQANIGVLEDKLAKLGKKLSGVNMMGKKMKRNSK